MPQLDSCEQPGEPGAALQDPFVRGGSDAFHSAGGSRYSSQPATCRPSEAIPEEEREALLEIQPQEVSMGHFESMTLEEEL